VNVHILASTSAPFTLLTVQVPNLALSHTKWRTVWLWWQRQLNTCWLTVDLAGRGSWCRSRIQCTSCCTSLILALVTETAEYLLADRRPGWKVKLVQVLDPVHKLLHFLSTDSGDNDSLTCAKIYGCVSLLIFWSRLNQNTVPRALGMSPKIFLTFSKHEIFLT
jgi:hypothetical protein